MPTCCLQLKLMSPLPPPPPPHSPQALFYSHTFTYNTNNKHTLKKTSLTKACFCDEIRMWYVIFLSYNVFFFHTSNVHKMCWVPTSWIMLFSPKGSPHTIFFYCIQLLSLLGMCVNGMHVDRVVRKLGQIFKNYNFF